MEMNCTATYFLSFPLTLTLVLILVLTLFPSQSIRQAQTDILKQVK